MHLCCDVDLPFCSLLSFGQLLTLWIEAELSRLFFDVIRFCVDDFELVLFKSIFTFPNFENVFTFSKGV